MRPFLIAILLFVGLAGCRKEVIVTTEAYKPPYRISGLSDIIIKRTPFTNQPNILAQFSLNVYYEYGRQQRVTLSMQNLPAGLKDSFYVRSGYPNFGTPVTFYDQGVQLGNYAAKLLLHVEGDSADISYPFAISISGESSCAGYFGGKTFKATNSCGLNNPVTPPYTVTSIRPNVAQDTVLIPNYNNSGDTLKLVINCKAREVVVPIQYINGILVQGNGSVNTLNTSIGISEALFLYVLERDAQGNIVSSCDYTYQLR